jgi:hypothetical protein
VKKLALLTVALFVFSSCARNGLVIVPKTQLSNLASDLYGSNVPKRKPGVVTVRIYLVFGTRLVAVDRSGQSSLPLPQLAMTELLKGASAAEQNQGISTNIPSTVQMLDISVDSGIASVDLSHDFELFTQDRATFLLRIAQIVYTLTELDTVQSVRFLVEGQPVSVLVQDGSLVAEPVARGRYSDFAPRTPGAAVSRGPLA